MNKNVYTNIDFVALNNENGRIECKYVHDFDESDDDIVIETEVPIEDIKRGWVGDMFCHLRGNKLGDPDHKVTTSKSIQNVLLSKITVYCKPNSAVCWRYTFLKD